MNYHSRLVVTVWTLTLRKYELKLAHDIINQAITYVYLYNSHRRLRELRVALAICLAAGVFL